MAEVAKKKAKGGKKNRKVGRSAKRCAAYKASHRREHNKVRRLKKHLICFPADNVAKAAVENALKLIRGY